MVIPAGWPYHQSTLYNKLDFKNPITRYKGNVSGVCYGNDQWPCSEDAVGGLLFVPCDGSGWNSYPAKPQWLVTDVTGSPDASGGGLSGSDLAMREREDRIKPQAILAFGSSNLAVWWQWLNESVNPPGTLNRTHVALSTDGGATFALNRALGDYLFRYNDFEQLSVWGALQLGAGYTAAGGIDNDYIYVYLTNNRQHTTSVWNKSLANGGHQGGTQYVARVRWKGGAASVSDVGDRTKYQVMTAFSGGVPTWGTAGTFTGTKEPAFIDPNGMALFFQPQWHSAINKFVATYIHCDNDAQGIAHQGIAVAISDNPFDKNGWTMIGYGQLLAKGSPAEVDYYMSVMAPSRWNDGTNMHFALSTYNSDGPTNPGDNLIVTRVALVATGTPDPGDGSADSFTYTLEDDWGQTTAQVKVNGGLGGGTTFVTTQDDSASTLPGTEVTIPVLDNDTASASLLPLQIQAGSVTVPSPSGAASITADNKIKYTPATGAKGIQASFSYVAKPSTAATPTATATVRVTVSDPDAGGGFLPANPDAIKASYEGPTINVNPSNYLSVLASAADGSRLIFAPGNYGNNSRALDSTPIPPAGKGRLLLLAQNPVFTDLDVTVGPGGNPMVGYNPNGAHSVITNNLNIGGCAVWMEGFRFGSADLKGYGGNPDDNYNATAPGRMSIYSVRTPAAGQRNWYVKNLHNRSVGKMLLMTGPTTNYVVHKNYFLGGVRSVSFGGYQNKLQEGWNNNYYVYFDGMNQGWCVENYFRGGGDQIITSKTGCREQFYHNNTIDHTIAVLGDTGGTVFFNGQTPDKINLNRSTKSALITHNRYYKAAPGGRFVVCGNTGTVIVENNTLIKVGSGNNAQICNFDVWSQDSGNTLIAPDLPTQWTFRNNTINGADWWFIFGRSYVAGTKVLIENNTAPVVYSGTWGPDAEGGMSGGPVFSATAKLEVHLGTNSKCALSSETASKTIRV